MPVSCPPSRPAFSAPCPYTGESPPGGPAPHTQPSCHLGHLPLPTAAGLPLAPLRQQPWATWVGIQRVSACRHFPVLLGERGPVNPRSVPTRAGDRGVAGGARPQKPQPENRASQGMPEQDPPLWARSDLRDRSCPGQGALLRDELSWADFPALCSFSEVLSLLGWLSDKSGQALGNFGIDHLVMSMCRVLSCVVGRGCLL